MKLLTKTAMALCLSVTAAHAETFRWAGTTDPQTMDPHAVSSAVVLGFLNNVYEGLVRRNKEMKIEPALATSWEPLGGDGWRFKLRDGGPDGAVAFREDVDATDPHGSRWRPALLPGTNVADFVSDDARRFRAAFVVREQQAQAASAGYQPKIKTLRIVRLF